VTEQSSAAEQVNVNMEQISQLVAESANGARQSAKACEQLSSSALDMQNVVFRFRLAGVDRHGQHGVKSTTAPTPAKARAAAAGAASGQES